MRMDQHGPTRFKETDFNFTPVLESRLQFHPCVGQFCLGQSLISPLCGSDFNINMHPFQKISVSYRLCWSKANNKEMERDEQPMQENQEVYR